ncbi:MAG TPA: hypothetical protein VJ732_15635 [Bryobacteraceae bacterium]|nr:hypothetical protein [Bryobacteraceae bacterium]
MSRRFPRCVEVLGGLCLLLLPAGVVTGAPQANGPAAKAARPPFTPPRTAWGDPDLQGVYTFATATPFQRPAALGNKEVYTAAEQRQLQQQLQEKQKDNIATNEHFSYNALWFEADAGRLTGQTSLIVDPPDGRMPPLTPRGEKLRAENAAKAAARRSGGEVIRTWEDHSMYNRCLSRPFPRITQEYNQGVEILQTPGQVVIFYESMHDVRAIPLDGRPHLDPSLRQWNGDPRGHWEGDTLVVDSTNFTDQQKSNDSAPFGGFPQGNMHLTERFTRIDAKTIRYVVTVEDPTIWTRPFTIAMPWRADDPAYKGPQDLFEYACHEGNYRMMEDTITASHGAKEGPK